MFTNINVPEIVSKVNGASDPSVSIFKLHGRLASINRDQQMCIYKQQIINS